MALFGPKPLNLEHLKDPTIYFLCQMLSLTTIISLDRQEKANIFIYVIVIGRILHLIVVLDSLLQ